VTIYGVKLHIPTFSTEVKMAASWDVKPPTLVERYKYFGGILCFDVQGT